MIGLKNKQTNKQKKKTTTINPVTYAKISPEMVNPRDTAGNSEEEKN